MLRARCATMQAATKWRLWWTRVLRLRSRAAVAVVGALALGFTMPVAAQDDTDYDEYEYEADEGLHQQEWYDPSDWFDPDNGVDYESDWDDYYYPYDYDPYDYDYYGADYDPYGYDYYYGYDYDTYPYGYYGYHDYYPYYGYDYDYYDVDYERDRDQRQRDRAQQDRDRYARDRQRDRQRYEDQRRDRYERDQYARDQYDRNRDQYDRDRYARDRHARDRYARDRYGSEREWFERQRDYDDQRRREEIARRDRYERDRHMREQARRDRARRDRMARRNQWRRDRLEGEIAGVENKKLEGMNRAHTIAKVETPSGKTRKVILGPKDQMADLDLRDGDDITVVAYPGKVNGQQMMLASWVAANGQRIDLDDQRDWQRGPKTDRKSSRRGRMDWHPRGERLRGEVVSTRTASFDGVNKNHLVARIEFDRGPTRLVDLGTKSHLDQKNVKIRQGDQVELKGWQGRINGQPAVIAHEVFMDGKRIELNRAVNRKQYDETGRQNRRDDDGRRQAARDSGS